MPFHWNEMFLLFNCHWSRIPVHVITTKSLPAGGRHAMSVSAPITASCRVWIVINLLESECVLVWWVLPCFLRRLLLVAAASPAPRPSSDVADSGQRNQHMHSPPSALRPPTTRLTNTTLPDVPFWQDFRIKSIFPAGPVFQLWPFLDNWK